MRLMLSIIVMCSLMACKSDSKEKDEIRLKSNSSVNYDNKATTQETKKDSEADSYDDEKNLKNADSSNNDVIASETIYRNVSNEDAVANCNSIAINYSKATDLCIDAEGITIKVRYAKANGKTEMYFSKLVSNTTDKEIPFDSFDTTTPLAIISATANNTLTLDWKGFTQNGDIATNYAILGKKNLEGTFKKQ